MEPLLYDSVTHVNPSFILANFVAAGTHELRGKVLKSNLLVARFGELVGSPDFLVHEEAVRFFANMAIEGRMDYIQAITNYHCWCCGCHL